VNGVKQ